MKDIHKYKNYYFIGIGGIGMSSLARYFKYLNANVCGYDKTQTVLTKELETEGIDIIFEDNITLLPNHWNVRDTLVIYTPAIPNNLGIKNYFIEKGFDIFKRAKVLGEISRYKKCVAIAGTHGKTTTSTLLGHICKYARLPVTVFLGGISLNYNSNFIYQGNDIVIIEADEYDRSFLNLFPNIASISSTDLDHLDIYGDGDSVLKGFNDFADLVGEEGFLLVKKNLKINAKNKLCFSLDQETDYYVENIRIERENYVFDLFTPELKIEGLILPFPGRHNIENAVVASSIALKLGVSVKILREALLCFRGIRRRFVRNIINDKIYIDDYAHHPTEINSIIKGVRELYPDKKLLTVFQPHLFSRTRDFLDGFAKSLSKSDKLILLDIYPAREIPIKGVTSELLVEKIDLENVEVVSLKEALNTIKKKKDFDILLTIGAGDIDTLYKPIIKWLNEI